MPWKVVTVMSCRKEFISLALAEGTNFRSLCQRFGVSRKTGYKWIERFRLEGDLGIADRSRRPKTIPVITPEETEGAIVRLRKRHPSWGGRKIHFRLKAQGREIIPAPSTITDILRRNGLIDPQESGKHKAWQRFEAEFPNDLWQMDFKGHVPVADGRCHPLTVLDDHSRYSLGVRACSDEKRQTVQYQLTKIFRRYGMPRRIIADNGAPWGGESDFPYSRLTVWLLRLGIAISHSRPYHPQTMGKDERFHRTLAIEVLQYCSQLTIAGCQTRFDEWREIYNYERPHESLRMQVPGSRYRVSPRCFPELLPPLEYGADDLVRKVSCDGIIFYRNREYRISKAFSGEHVALRPTQQDGVYDVYFCNHKIDELDIRGHTCS